MKKNKIYKKKDLTELVDEKGGKIQGQSKIDQSDNATTSVDTTDDHVHKSRQGMSRYMFRRFYGENDQSKEPKTTKEISEEKMRKVLEDLISKKNYDSDVIDKVKYTNGIPDIDTIKEKHTVLVRKVSHFNSLINNDEVSGEDKAILINSILSTNLTDIPSPYKKELIKKIK